MRTIQRQPRWLEGSNALELPFCVAKPRSCTASNCVDPDDVSRFLALMLRECLDDGLYHRRTARAQAYLGVVRESLAEQFVEAAVVGEVIGQALPFGLELRVLIVGRPIACHIAANGRHSCHTDGVDP